MDEFTERHFRAWLDASVAAGERSKVEAGIRQLVSEHPDLLKALSWPEMRGMAERNASWGLGGGGS